MSVNDIYSLDPLNRYSTKLFMHKIDKQEKADSQ
jgi:hypothetical protein